MTTSPRTTLSPYATSDDTPPSRRFTILFTTAMFAIAIGWAWLWHAKTERLVVGPPPVLAVAGVVIDSTVLRAGTGPIAADSAAGVIGDMLSVGIRRIGLPVLETTQLYALSNGRAGGAALVDAARALDATQVVQGELRVAPDGTWELEARRVDAYTRDLIVMLRTRGTGPIDVVDRMAAQIAMSVGMRVPDGSVADAMTGAVDAYVAYEAGLRALHAGDTAAALLRLDDALRRDPTFAAARQLRDSYDPAR